MRHTETTSPDPSAGARLRYLDGVLEYLWDLRNLRGLICLVERWSSVETPTRTGRLYQVRALLALRLMDRAWLHLKKLLEESPDDLQTISLAVELFLARGWPSRARKLLEGAKSRLPPDPELNRLIDATQGPARTPPSNARAIEQNGSPAELLELAERFLATGSFLRARALLERVRHAEPANARVKDLLWGLDGDFDVGDVRPEELASQLAPTFQDHHQAPIDLEPPGQEEVTATRIPLEDDDAHEAEFPALFRRVGPGPLPLLDDDTGEITQARALASPEELQDPDHAPLGAGEDLNESRHEDTEIMMVIPKGGISALDAAKARVHRKRPQVYDLKASLDLDDYRRHMGVEPRGRSDLAEDPDDTEETPERDSQSVQLEDEDADLVVVTRREEPAGSAPTAPGPGPQKPMRVIEKHPTPEHELQPESVRVTPEPRVPRPPPRSRPPRPPPPRPAPVDDDDEIEFRGGAGGGRLAFVGLVVVVLIALAAWQTVERFTGMSGPRAVNMASKALASDRYDALLRAEGALAPHIPAENQAADPALIAAMARIEIVLWAEQQPYPERVEQARALVERALAVDEPPPVARLAAAELAAMEWRSEQAREHLEAYGIEDAHSMLVEARLHALDGDHVAAAAAASRATQASPSSARAWRELASLQRQVGDLSAARTALHEAASLEPGNPRQAILAMLLENSEEPGRLPEAARQLSADLSTRYTPPRVEAEIFMVVAEALPSRTASAVKDWAMEQAFAKDSTDPELLAFFAARDVAEHHLVDAERRLQKATRYRPGDMNLREALLHVLLDLDRIEAATKVVDEAAEARPGHPDLTMLRAWLLVFGSTPSQASNNLPRAASLIEPFIEAHPKDGEAPWLLGTAMLDAGDKRALTLLSSAAQLLAAPETVDGRELVPRSLATLVRAGHPGSAKLLKYLNTNAQNDPRVHLLLALGAMDSGRITLAGRHLAQATEAGPELARAHYEQGRYYRDYRRDTRRMRASWDRYLLLEPSGARAREVSSQR